MEGDTLGGLHFSGAWGLYGARQGHDEGHEEEFGHKNHPAESHYHIEMSHRRADNFLSSNMFSGLLVLSGS